MRLILLLIISFGLAKDGISQYLKPTNCDSVYLSKEELEKCKGDTIFTADVFDGLNYIAFLKTGLLPRYRLKRTALTLPTDLRRELKELKKLYDSILTYKLYIFTQDMDKNQKYVQPKAYLASILSLQIFRIYPDVYAILLNPIHLELNPKTTESELKQFRQSVYKVYRAITNWNNSSIFDLAKALNEERRKYSASGDLFQGAVDEEEKYVHSIVNFLLWTE